MKATPWRKVSEGNRSQKSECSCLATSTPQEAPSQWDLQAKQALSNPAHVLLLHLNEKARANTASPVISSPIQGRAGWYGLSSLSRTRCRQHRRDQISTFAFPLGYMTLPPPITVICRVELTLHWDKMK